MSWVAVGVAAASVVSGGIESSASGKATRAETRGQQNAINALSTAERTSNERLNPYAGLGRVGVNNLMSVYGQDDPDYTAFHESPGYRFAFDEGQKAVENSATARGMTLSGPQLKALNRFGHGMAGQEFGNFFNRQMRLTDVGQNAVNSQNVNSMNAAFGIADAHRGIGNARASGFREKGGIFSDTIGDVVGSFGKKFGF